MERKTVLKFLVLIILVGVLVYLFRFSGLSERLSPLALREFVQGFGVLGFLIFVGVYALGTVFAVPGTLLTFTGAILFGTVLGTILNVVGATIGETVAFFVARYLGKDFVESLLKGRVEKFQDLVKDKGFTVMLILRLVPLFPFVVVNYAAGLSRVRFRDYFLASVIGIIPGAFVYTYLFATIGERVLTEGFKLKDLLTIEVLIPIVLFVLLLLVTLLYKRRVELKLKQK